MSLRLAALVPAAGRSTRMGRPKLLLSLGTETVIERVVRSLRQGGADPILVVAPPLDQEGAPVLAETARRAGAWVVHCPEVTADMRATCEVGLCALNDITPTPDGLLLAPGDCAGIGPELVAEVVRRFAQHPATIVVPRHGDRRGHPLALPWTIAREIAGLASGAGINSLVRRHCDRVVELTVTDAGTLQDLNTPEDYQRWRDRPG